MFFGASIYERIGGEPAMNAAVDLFYKKMMADDRVSKYFVNTNMKFQA